MAYDPKIPLRLPITPPTTIGTISDIYNIIFNGPYKLWRGIVTGDIMHQPWEVRDIYKNGVWDHAEYWNPDLQQWIERPYIPSRTLDQQEKSLLRDIGIAQARKQYGKAERLRQDLVRLEGRVRH